jgi:hypothetical protein
MKSAKWNHVLCKKCAYVLQKVCKYRISVGMKSAEHESLPAESVEKLCMIVVNPQKKSAKSLQKVCIS